MIDRTHIGCANCRLAELVAEWRKANGRTLTCTEDIVALIAHDDGVLVRLASGREFILTLPQP